MTRHTAGPVTVQIVGLCGILYVGCQLITDAWREGPDVVLASLAQVGLLSVAGWRLVRLRRWVGLLIAAGGWALAAMASLFTEAPGGGRDGINWDFFPGAVLFALTLTVATLCSWRQLRSGF